MYIRYIFSLILVSVLPVTAMDQAVKVSIEAPDQVELWKIDSTLPRESQLHEIANDLEAMKKELLSQSSLSPESSHLDFLNINEDSVRKGLNNLNNMSATSLESQRIINTKIDNFIKYYTYFRNTHKRLTALLIKKNPKS